MKKSMNKTAQAGFTLIELIVVIVILGILAATALPKFVNMGADARFASLKAGQGAVNSAVALAHSKALVSNQTGATGTIDADGTSVTLKNGYPTIASLPTVAGIDGYTTVSFSDTSSTGYAGPTLNDPASATPQVAFVPNGIALTSAKAATCAVVYTEATSSGTPAVITAPTVTVAATDSTGCE